MQSRFALACLSLLISVAAGAPEGVPPTQTTATFLPLDDPSVAEIRVIGEKATIQVKNSLEDDAASSIADYSGADAVSLCHLKSLPSQGPLMPDLPRVAAIKLTSLQLRDSGNAPDAAEKLALERVRAAVAAKLVPPSLLVQCIDGPDGGKEWRVYRPVYLVRRCLLCHGPVESQSADLQAVLQRRFPADAAVGYQSGQWRGLVRVTVSDVPHASPAATP